MRMPLQQVKRAAATAAAPLAKSRAARLWQHPQLRYATFLGLWLVVFAVGALPAWNASYRNDKRLRTASATIEALTDMAAAGAWFNAAAASWQPLQEKEYDVRFPREKGREQLFLELAQVASAADIDPFGLREIPLLMSDATDEYVDEMAMTTGETDLSRLMGQFATDTSGLPSTELQTYRLVASFDADYIRMARFFTEIESVPRALSLHSLTAAPNAEGINVSMELDFYVQTAR